MLCYEISNCPISFLLDRGWFVVAAVLHLCWSRFSLLPLRSFLPSPHSYCIFSPAIFLFFLLLLKTVWDWVIILFLHVIPYAFRGSSIFFPRTPFFSFLFLGAEVRVCGQGFALISICYDYEAHVFRRSKAKSIQILTKVFVGLRAF